jgi:hypothetical protein
LALSTLITLSPSSSSPKLEFDKGAFGAIVDIVAIVDVLGLLLLLLLFFKLEGRSRRKSMIRGELFGIERLRVVDFPGALY